MPNNTNNPSVLMQHNLENFKHTIVVMSGKGGVGKSTVSINLAYALAGIGKQVGILDVDLHGPSAAKMTGTEGIRNPVSERGNPEPIQAEQNLYVLSLASMLGDVDTPVIWRGPMKTKTIKQFLDSFEWPPIDYLIVDCPPGTGDEPLSVLQTIPNVDGAVIVTTPQEVALIDARKAIAFSRQLDVPILGIVENMSGFVCPKCGEHMDIFKSGGAEKAADDFKIQLLGKIPLNAQIVESGDSGKPWAASQPDGPFSKIAQELTTKLD